MKRTFGEKYVIGLLVLLILIDFLILYLTVPGSSLGSMHIGNSTIHFENIAASKRLDSVFMLLIEVSGLLLFFLNRTAGWILTTSLFLYFTLNSFITVKTFYGYKEWGIILLFVLLSLAGLLGMASLMRTVTRHRFQVNNLSYLLVLIFTAVMFVFVFRL
jgi:hypothetical protein